MDDPSVSMLGALGMLNSLCCVTTGITCILQNCWVLGFRGEKAARLPMSEVCAGREGSGWSGQEAEGLSQAPEPCIPRQSVYKQD